MAISYVGGKGAGAAGQGGGSISLTSGLTGGSGGSPLEGDLVVVTVSVGTAGRQPTISISTPSGYTALTAQRTTATSFDANVQTCYKIMGSTPDTTVTIPASGNNQDGISYAIQVFRGVNAATPIDVTSTYATGTGTALVNPAAITPLTSGAWIVVCGGGAATTGANYTAGYLTNLVTNFGSDTNDSLIGCGYYTGWTSGSYDPAAFGGGSNTANDGWGCTTIALRPKPNPQTLTQSSRFDNSNSFYAAVVSHGLTQSSRFDNSNSFYAATVTPGAVTLTQSSRFDNSNSFNAHTVNHGLTQSARFDNSNSFYAATVNHGLMQGSTFANSGSFYSGTVSHGLTQASRFDSSNDFYAAVVSLGGTQTLLPSLLSNSNSFYAPVVSHGLIQATRFDNNSAFYAETVSHGLAQASRFDNSAAFYSVTVTAPGATQSLIQNTVFDDQDSFYAATVTTGPVTLVQDSLFTNANQFFGVIVDAATQSVQATYGTLREYFGALEKNRKKLKKAKAKIRTAIKQAAQAEIEQDEPISINRIERAIENEGIAVDEQFYVITLQILKSLEHKQIKAKIQQAIRDIEERIRQIIKAEKLKQEEDELMLIMTMI